MVKYGIRRRIIVTASFVAATCTFGAVSYFWLYPRSPGPWEQVTISTATRGGTYYILGSQLARVLERLPGNPIKHVKAELSRGSQENIQRLIKSQADVALVQGPALTEAVRENPDARQKLRVLVRLYPDVVQIVVRKDAGIKSLTDLRNKRVYIGAQSSGTRMLATHILETVGLSEGKYTADDAVSYTEAAERLINGEIDAAIYAAGKPTEAVRTALESGKGKLISLDENTVQKLTQGKDGIGLVEKQVPASFYQNQLERAHTVGADVFLVCRNDLPQDLAYLIVEALFDKISDLLLAHTVAQDIKLTSAFEVPEGLALHPGTRKFQENERGALLIATGAVNGKYYHTGKMIRLLLKERGIHARVVHTDGSLENAKLLRTRPTIAIMQYDAALASRLGQPEFVYNVDLDEVSISIPEVENIRRIAVLHQEKVHIIMRRDKLASIEEKLKWGPATIATLSELAEAIKELPAREKKLRICLGASNSGTQVVAQVILKHHNIELTSIIPSFLSVSDMVNRLHSGEIDMGFFVSHVPSEAVKTILNDETIRLLSLGPKERAPMAGTVFSTSTIEPGMYGSQKEDEPAIQTVTTRAVLVTTEDLPFDVKTITKAIFEEYAFLGIAGGKDSMAVDLSSLPLHPAARAYYQAAKLLPSKPPIDWLGHMWRGLASLAILLGGYKSLIVLRRDRTRNRIGRRIFSIQLQANVPDSIDRLRQIRDEIRVCAQRRWWQSGELDKPRWRHLQDLIDGRIRDAKNNLTLALVSEIRSVAQNDDLDETALRGRRGELEKRLWTFLENGQLDISQHELLLGMLGDSGA